MDCLLEAIEDIKKELSYPVIVQEIEEEQFKTRFNHDEKVHEIYCPVDEDIKFFHLDLLHEYVHCKINESLKSNFPRITDISENPNAFLQYNMPTHIRVVKDWFVFGNLVSICTNETLEQVQVDYQDFVKKIQPDMSIHRHLIAGLGIASGIKWLDLENDLQIPLLNRFIECFLQVDPKNPNAENHCKLLVKIINAENIYDAYITEEYEIHVNKQTT